MAGRGDHTDDVTRAGELRQNTPDQASLQSRILSVKSARRIPGNHDSNTKFRNGIILGVDNNIIYSANINKECITTIRLLEESLYSKLSQRFLVFFGSLTKCFFSVTRFLLYRESSAE